MKLKLQTTKLTPYLIATVVILLVCFYSRAPRWMPGVSTLERLELMSFDWRVRDAVRRSPVIATNLGFVEITDDSVAAVASGELGYEYGLLWPRQIYGRIVRELAAQGAKAVAFDVLFGELRPDHPKIAIPGRAPMESDAFFAQQCRSNGRVILATANGVPTPPLFRSNAWAIGHIEAPRDDDGVLRRATPFIDIVDWSDNIRVFARANGIELTNAIIEPRRIKLRLSDGGVFILHTDTQKRFNKFDLEATPPPSGTAPIWQKAFMDRRVWNLGLLLASHELKLDLEHSEFDWNQGVLILRGQGNVERRVPLDEEGNFYIDWSSTSLSRKLTTDKFHALLGDDKSRLEGGAVTNGVWKDKLVVVGSTATGNNLTDRGATPLEKETPLMSKHWNVANMFLTGRFIQRMSYRGELALLAGLGILSVVVTWRLRAPWGTLTIAVIGGAFVLAALQLYVQQRYWIPIVLPVLGALVLNHAALVTYQVIFEQKEKRRVKAMFSRLVSPNIVNELLSRDEELHLGGARRNITVLFADVRGFTQMTDVNQAKAEAYVKEHNLQGAEAESYFDETARETLDTVNIYLATISNQVKKHDGTLDKYIGDCVMAFWGAPLADEKHAVACVSCAIDAQRAMYDLNERRKEENKQREEENKQRAASGQAPKSMLALLSLGTGINSGISIVGMMGSMEHTINYTIFGREVNLASRLEGVSGRGRIIIGETTYSDLVRFDAELAKTCVELDPVHVKGIEKAVRIFEVPWKTPEALAAEAAAKAAQASANTGLPAVAKS